MKQILLSLFVLGFVFTGCKSEKGATVRGVPADFSLYMKRTACMGRCPVYELYVDAQGQVKYQGYLNVEKEGRFEKELSPATLRKLVKAVEDAGYFEMDKVYDQGIADLPGVEMKVSMRGQKQQIMAKSGTPKALTSLHDQVDELIGEDGYTEVAKK